MRECYFWSDYDWTVALTGGGDSTYRVARRGDAVAKAFGKRVRDMRLSKGWSQERLADEARMHRTYMWGIEQGVRNPSLRHLAKLAAALAVPLCVLFEDI